MFYRNKKLNLDITIIVVIFVIAVLPLIILFIEHCVIQGQYNRLLYYLHKDSVLNYYSNIIVGLGTLFLGYFTFKQTEKYNLLNNYPTLDIKIRKTGENKFCLEIINHSKNTARKVQIGRAVIFEFIKGNQNNSIDILLHGKSKDCKTINDRKNLEIDERHNIKSIIIKFFDCKNNKVCVKFIKKGKYYEAGIPEYL